MQLAGVLAHELAHDDLGHVARTRTRGTGGFFATHPATSDRIEALRNVR